MRYLILLFILFATSINNAVAVTPNQKLLCQGWTYIRDSNGVLLNPNISNESGEYTQLIDVDISNMKISAMTDYGEIKAPLVVTDEAYSGDYTPNLKIEKNEISNIRIHVNRYTGKGSITAIKADKTGGFTIFNGECKSQQRRF